MPPPIKYPGIGGGGLNIYSIPIPPPGGRALSGCDTVRAGVGGRGTDTPGKGKGQRASGLALSPCRICAITSDNSSGLPASPTTTRAEALRCPFPEAATAIPAPGLGAAADADSVNPQQELKNQPISGLYPPPPTDFRSQ
eukprot:g13403.t1